MTDQQKASASSLLGNSHLRTPAWDRLAAEGVSFRQAYAQSPICTPSRASMMTGTYPLVHRVLCHQNHAPENLTQLPELLSEAGYRTVGAGHYEADRELDRGWHHQIDMVGTPELEEAVRTLYACGSRRVGWSAGELPRRPDEAHAACLNRELFGLLDELDPEEAPLFVHVAYLEPHPPYFAPRGYVTPQRGGDLPLPGVGDLETRPAWHRQALADFCSGEARHDDVRRLLGVYYGLIEYADREVGRLLDYLDRRGLSENAWIILCSDHGDYAGEKGFFAKSETPYECLLHVPLVIRGPRGRWVEGRTEDRLVELLDLFPTILAAAGCGGHGQAQGHDLIRWISEGSRRPLRRAAFAAVGGYLGPLGTTMPWGLPASGRHPGIVCGARDLEYSYIQDPDYGDEAYDLRRDPMELVNLGGDPPGGARRLRRWMEVWQEDCRRHYQDLGVIPGDRNFDQPPPRNIVG